MAGCRFKVRRKPWDLPFLAEPEELAGLRRVIGLHLGLWGLPDLIDSAQLCVTELVTNVITHVGHGTPTTLTVSMNGQFLRLAVTDPDVRALPTLLAARGEEESGRGMALVDSVATRWGVILRADTKVTWCEMDTGLRAADDHVGDPQVEAAEALLVLCCLDPSRAVGPLSAEVGVQTTVRVITDLLYWLRMHGCDPDKVLDRAKLNFDIAAEGVS
ncbi:ATP-binding protein [Streptomyces sp. NPDC023838]|uniref:ATP-binding protein n=1 Tax=Streptomyces sp. NPDC023838 TaxID=3154325 RepID=UPI0033F37D64